MIENGMAPCDTSNQKQSRVQACAAYNEISCVLSSLRIVILDGRVVDSDIVG